MKHAHEIRNVPISKIHFGGTIDSRRSNKSQGIDELAASIMANGILLPLSVRELWDEGNVEIIDGNRRFEAIMKLHKEGKFDGEVPVLVRDADDINASQMSLAANIMRLPLHPVDQFEAFSALLEAGRTTHDVAVAFGCSEKLVRQRAALGKVIPEWLEEYRESTVEARLLEKLAVVDVEKQKKLHDEFKVHGLQWQIMDMLRRDRIATSDVRLKAVGMEAYKQAGGRIEEDLFGEEDHSYVTDVDLLAKLHEEKVEEIRKAKMDEGWLNVVYEVDARGMDGWMTTFHPDIVRTKKDQKRYEKLASMDELTGDELDELEELETKGTVIVPADQTDLYVIIQRSLHHYYAKFHPYTKERAGEGDAPKAEDKTDPTVISGALADILDGQRTHAIQNAVAVRGPVKLSMAMFIVAALNKQMGQGYCPHSAMANLNPYPLNENLAKEVEGLVKKYKLGTAKTPAKLIEKVMEMNPDDLEALFTIAAASTFLMVRDNKDASFALPYVHIDETFSPSPDHFARYNKQQLIRIADEENIEVRHLGKKQEIAELIAATIRPDWLPDRLKGLQHSSVSTQQEAAE